MAKVKLAIDFDCAVTNIYRVGAGVVLSEPTVAAIETDKDEVKFIGNDAKKLIGKTAKNTKIVFPVFEGEIVNEKVASGLLAGFCNKIEAKNGLFDSNTALFSVPCGTTSETLTVYRKVANDAGINKVYFAEAPLLSALGQRLIFSESTPCFVIDMAGGVTNIAALSLDGIIAGISVNFGYSGINAALIDYIADNFGIQIGLQSADRLRKNLVSLEENDGLSSVVSGRNVDTGKPMALSLKAYELTEPIKKYYDKIAEIAMEVLKKLPAEVSAEIKRSGIYVSGGGSSVYGLENYYTEKFGMKVTVAEHGLMSVALGGGVAMSDDSILKKIILDF